MTDVSIDASPVFTKEKGNKQNGLRNARTLPTATERVVGRNPCNPNIVVLVKNRPVWTATRTYTRTSQIRLKPLCIVHVPSQDFTVDVTELQTEP